MDAQPPTAKVHLKPDSVNILQLTTVSLRLKHRGRFHRITTELSPGFRNHAFLKESTPLLSDPLWEKVAAPGGHHAWTGPAPTPAQHQPPGPTSAAPRRRGRNLPPAEPR